MNNLPFPTFDLKGCEVDSILEIYNKLKEIYSINYQAGFKVEFSGLEIFKLYESAIIGPVISIQNKSSSFFITFIQVAYKLPSAARYIVHPATLEYQTYGILTLK